MAKARKKKAATRMQADFSWLRRNVLTGLHAAITDVFNDLARYNELVAILKRLSETEKYADLWTDIASEVKPGADEG